MHLADQLPLISPAHGVASEAVALPGAPPAGCRVTFVISSLRLGGSERVVSILANNWAARGWPVTVLTLNHGREPPAFDLHPSVHHLRLKRGEHWGWDPYGTCIRSLANLGSLLNNRLFRWVRSRIFRDLAGEQVAGFSRLKSTLRYLRYAANWLGRRVWTGVRNSWRRMVKALPTFSLSINRGVGFVRRVAGRALRRAYRLGKTGLHTVHAHWFAFEDYCWQRQFMGRRLAKLFVWISELLPSPLRWEQSLIQDIRAAIVSTGPEIVISFMAGNNIRAIRATSLLDVPTVISERSAPQRPFPRSAQLVALRGRMYPRADTLVVQTDSAGEFFKDMMNGKIDVIPNPVMPNSARGTAVVRRTNRLVAVGRLVHEKGYDRLIDSFDLIQERHRAWTVDIWGDGPLRSELEKLIRARGLEGRVILQGSTKEVDRILSQADVYVMTSRFEGFPNALCEAMASGLPSVAFDCPTGPGAIINNNINGILVSDGDIDGFASAMTELITNHEKRARLGNKAMEVTETFSVDRVMKRWDSVVERAIKRRVRVRKGPL